MNNEDQRVQKIEKNAFEYYACSKIVVPIPFVYLKNVEFLKQQGSEEPMLLQCCQSMIYLLTDPASNFFFFLRVNIFIAQTIRYVTNPLNFFVWYG
jgi:hypothetical protein